MYFLKNEGQSPCARRCLTTLTFLAVAWMGVPPAAAIDPDRRINIVERADGKIEANRQVFDSWNAYANSAFFAANGLRCATRVQPANRPPPVAAQSSGGSPSDCSLSNTTPDLVYDPAVVRYRIPVVVHVIRKDDGVTGHISEQMVQSQIDILNEDFLAMMGTNGQNGLDGQIEFFLATTDPAGNPTNGITYHNNTTWFNDNGGYYNSIAWDTNRYMNVYTNLASGALGYVPNLPQGGIVGLKADRVVILWSSFGRNAPIGPPFNQGRTLTHEVGHYLGLDHPFADFTCPPSTGCFNNGDLICDTNPQSTPTSGCFDQGSCGSPDAIRNYMDYSSDLCMEEFSSQQVRRMRCTIEFYRPNLFTTGGDACGNGVLDAGELCDIAIAPGAPGACPTTCDSGDACVDGTLINDGTCNAECQFSDITTVIDGDGCCPPGGNAVNDSDCVAACGNGFCEPGEETTCSADCSCATDAQCSDGFVCTRDRCVGQTCSFVGWLFGDFDDSGVVNVFDLFCMLDVINNDFSSCTVEQTDLAPCNGDGQVTIFDVLAMLDALSGITPCCQ